MMINQFSVVVKTSPAPCVVVCKDAGERNSVVTECERDGYPYSLATDADQSLDRIDYLDWNPA